jgi:hypothetical protein
MARKNHLPMAGILITSGLPNDWDGNKFLPDSGCRYLNMQGLFLPSLPTVGLPGLSLGAIRYGVQARRKWNAKCC